MELYYGVPHKGNKYISRLADLKGVSGLANEKNLKPLNTRPKSDQRRIQQMGVDASREARKQKSSIKSILEQWADAPIKVSKFKKQAEQFGIETNEGRSLLTLALIQGAMKGNSQYMERVLNLLGEDEAGNNEPTDDGFNEAIKGTASEDWEESGNV
jgi:hypothetical protein